MATVFDKIFAGQFLDAGGAGYNVLHPDSGVVGDRVADDTVAFQNFYDSLPAASTILVPPDCQIRHTGQLSLDRNINIVCQGISAAFVPDLNDPNTDAIVVNDTASALLYAVKLHINVLSAFTDCCRNGVVLNRTHLSDIYMHVKVQAAEWGVVLNGCLGNRNIRIVTSVNFTYPYMPLLGGMPTLGAVRGLRDTTNAVSINANSYDFLVEGSIVHLSDGAGQGNCEISGIIEGSGLAGPALLCEDMIAVHVHDLHPEANTGTDIHFDGCANVVLGPGIWTDGEIKIEDCYGVSVDGVTCNTFELAGTNYRVSNRVLHFNVLGTGSIIDPDDILVQLMPVANIAQLASPSGFDFEAMVGEVPNTGWYKKGYFAPNTNKVVKGSGGSQYIVQGWDRLTTGNGHVLNTDWVQVRTLTGT